MWVIGTLFKFVFPKNIWSKLMVKETASDTCITCIISPWQRTVLASQEHWAGHMAPVLATIITNTVTNIVTLAAAILTNYGDYNC